MNWALRFAKWHYYLGCLDIPLPWRPSLRVFLAGFTMAISPGKLGEVLKAVLVRDLVGTHVSRTASVVMAERLTDVAGLVVLAALGVTALPRGPLLLLADRPGARRRRGGPQDARPWDARPGGSCPPAWSSPLGCSSTAGERCLGTRALAVALALSVVSWFFECLAFSLILRGPRRRPCRSVPRPSSTRSPRSPGRSRCCRAASEWRKASLTALLAGFGTPLAEAAAATLLVRSVTLWLAVALGAVTLLVTFPGAAGTRPLRA